jgi:hypothetical protein
MKKYKVNTNPAILYFEVFYVVYIGWMLIERNYQEAFVSSVGAIFIFSYLLLLRPYMYSIDRKTLTIHKRIGKGKELNLMKCETICDPVAKMSRLITNPHAIEIYTEGKKRYVLSPKDRLGFVRAVAVANKRIHVQVKDYAKKYKAVEREKKDRKKK